MLIALSKPVRLSLFRKVTMIAGTIAIERVIITLYHTGRLMSKKPSITN